MYRWLSSRRPNLVVATPLTGPVQAPSQGYSSHRRRPSAGRWHVCTRGRSRRTPLTRGPTGLCPRVRSQHHRGLIPKSPVTTSGQTARSSATMKFGNARCTGAEPPSVGIRRRLRASGLSSGGVGPRIIAAQMPSAYSREQYACPTAQLMNVAAACATSRNTPARIAQFRICVVNISDAAGFRYVNDSNATVSQARWSCACDGGGAHSVVKTSAFSRAGPHA